MKLTRRPTRPLATEGEPSPACRRAVP